MSDQTQGNRQSQEEDNTSTIPQPPEGQDPLEDLRPSQAEGDRDTIDADLQDNGGQNQG